MKNFRHLVSIQEAAKELHELLAVAPWYVRTAVETLPPGSRSAVTDKRESKQIVVFVRDLSAVQGRPTAFNGWPVIYKLGI